jgi:hypothetical protein
MNEASVWNEIWSAAVTTAQVLAKGSLVSAVVTALSWMTCEWVLFPLRGTSELFKRQVTLLVGMLMVFLAHWSGLVDFGPGPRGWGAAVFFGFVGGGLAPALHARIKDRFPAVTNTGAAAAPSGPGEP